MTGAAVWSAPSSTLIRGLTGMDLLQSRHGCAEIKRGPEGPRGMVDRGGQPSRQRPIRRYFFSTVVPPATEPVAVGAPCWGWPGWAGGLPATALTGGLAST